MIPDVVQQFTPSYLPVDITTGNRKVRVDILGVSHSHEFYKRFRFLFERTVREQAAALVMEGPEDEAYENFLYGSIMDMAAERKIPLYCGDPASDVGTLADVAEMMGGMALGVNALLPWAKKGLTRRDFLKRAGMFTGGTYFALQGSLRGLNTNLNERGFSDGPFSYNYTIDYRNIVNTNNLLRIAAQPDVETPLAFFIGAGHVPGIKHYLERPEALRKRLLYAPCDLVSETRVRKYRHDGKMWALEKAF